MKLPHKWMSDSYRSRHARFLQPIIMGVYWVAFAVLVAPPFLLGLAFGIVRNGSDAIMPILVLSAIPAWWFSKITAHHIAFDNHTFKIAAQNTFYPVVVKSAFLPVVGPYIERFISRPKCQNPFVASEEKDKK